MDMAGGIPPEMKPTTATQLDLCNQARAVVAANYGRVNERFRTKILCEI
jgi:hypothetical protein